MGNIPLTIAQDAPQFHDPAQSTDLNNFPNGQLQTNSTLPIGFIEPTPIPGFPQQISPYDQPPFTPPYPQQSMVPAHTNIPYAQPVLYPQTQQYNQSQLPYPDLNTQQPAFNPSYPNLNPEVTPSAPS